MAKSLSDLAKESRRKREQRNQQKQQSDTSEVVSNPTLTVVVEGQKITVTCKFELIISKADQLKATEHQVTNSQSLSTYNEQAFDLEESKRKL
jgi:hypothetical protein